MVSTIASMFICVYPVVCVAFVVIVSSSFFVHLYMLPCFHHFKISFVCFPPAPPPLPPAQSSPLILLPFDQLRACSSCDFVIWLLHGADDVVFAGQQKVTFFVSFCLVWALKMRRNHSEAIRSIRSINPTLEHDKLCNNNRIPSSSIHLFFLFSALYDPFPFLFLQFFKSQRRIIILSVPLWFISVYIYVIHCVHPHVFDNF